MKIWSQNILSKFLNRPLLSCLAFVVLAACSGTGQKTADSSTAAVSAASGEQAEPQVVKVPTSDEVMYRVFAAEYLGAEGDLPGAVEEYLVAAMESDDPAIARRATRVAYAAEA